jgi:hypothetical protein
MRLTTSGASMVPAMASTAAGTKNHKGMASSIPASVPK